MIDQIDLLTLRAARTQLHVNHRTLRRMLADAAVPLFENPADRRVLLVRHDDLVKMTTPRPILRPSEGEQPSPNAA